MNGKDDKFSIGLSKGNKTISKWVIPESLIIVPDEAFVAPTEKAVNVDGQTLSVENTKVDGNSTPISECKLEIDIEVNDEKTLDLVIAKKSADDTVVGEKRKHIEEPSDLVIPNTFKKSKTDSGCQNSK